MTTIHKYPFEIEDRFTLQIPAGARLLAVQMQGEQACLWAIVDPSKPPEHRTFRVFGTGQPIDDNIAEMTRIGMMTFIGTIQMMGGRLVFHVFEEVA